MVWRPSDGLRYGESISEQRSHFAPASAEGRTKHFAQTDGYTRRMWRQIAIALHEQLKKNVPGSRET